MRRVVIVLIRLLLGVVFLLAGVSKLGDPLRLMASVYSYRIDLPDWVAWTIAHGLPWMEMLLGLALLSGLWIRWTAPLVTGVLCLFLTLTAQAWWRDLPIDCGCLDLGVLHPSFSFLSTPLGATFRNLVLFGLALALIWLTRRSDVERL